MKQKAWNPFWFILISLFFSFVTAGLLAAFNYSRMGNLKMRRKTIIYTLIGFMIFCIFAFLLPLSLTKLLANAVNIGVGGYLFYKQLSDYVEWNLKYELEKKRGGVTFEDRKKLENVHYSSQSYV